MVLGLGCRASDFGGWGSKIGFGDFEFGVEGLGLENLGLGVVGLAPLAFEALSDGEVRAAVERLQEGLTLRV